MAPTASLLSRLLSTRARSLCAAFTLALCVLLSMLCGSAGAFVQEVSGTKVGLQQREVARYWEGTATWQGLGSNKSGSNGAAASFGNSSGNPVLHGANTYAIYWDPQNFYHGDWQGVVNRFLANLGASSGTLLSPFALDGQYRDATNQPATNGSSFHGAYTDTNPYPSSNCVDPRPFELGAPIGEVCLTDGQLRQQLETFIAQHGLPTGMSSIFYLLTPPGVAVCLDAGGASGHCSDFAGTIEEVEEAEEKHEEPASFKSYKRSFCSYHSFIGAGESQTVLYAAIPWTAGGAGDNHLSLLDATPGYDCQDGGFQPSTKESNGELEEKERPKPKTAQEQEEFEKKNAVEKREQEEAEALGLDGPHQQEPNQLSGRSPDGGFDTGLADLIVNQVAVEQQNIVTNPLLDAWQDPSGHEVTDECRNFFVPTSGGSASASPKTRAGSLLNHTFANGNYYVNAGFNLAALHLPYPGVPCLNGASLVPAFTAPNTVNSGELVGFDGMESDITLNSAVSFPSTALTYPTFTWDFGDGSPTVSGFAPGAAALNSPNATPCQAPWLSPCAASTFHSYQYGGTYNVTLTAEDVAGNTGSVTHSVTVAGPAPPTPAAPSNTGSGTSSGTGSSTTGATGGSGGSGSAGGSGGSTPVKVVASAGVSSHSLASALRHGLVIRYSVSAQATGRFEVLLASSIAKKIGLKGPAATGLAPGTPPQIVIAKAILVTTKAGHSSYRIKFSKSTAAKLRKLHKVSLMIRMVVHNASSPVATTVLSTANLSR
ncbi:MAG TPA: hypothetical protein VN672_02240 [Solirubrobacteraceae bacterium]|nr:hypothetical protein [Solirubrobacteraceae bacterium]